jgi:ketosteroid isomerase-like protein
MNVKKLWQWQRPINAAQALTPEGITQNFVSTTLGSAAILLGSLAWLLPSSIAATPPAQVPAVSSSVPPAIAALVKNWDAAASRKDLDSTMKFYSPSFTHGDGLDFKTQQQALQTFWKDATSIQYQTQISSLKADPQNRYTLETTTTLSGVRKAADRDMKLTSTVRSRLVIADQKIVSQEVLSEQTRLTAGDKPPSVNISLPEQVNVGQPFSFDAVVKEPLGDDLLLGSALEETISLERYLQPAVMTLEPLTSGGIFKTGQAPQQPTRKWISAVLIKNGGITIVSQRLNVVRPNGSTTPTPR